MTEEQANQASLGPPPVSDLRQRTVSGILWNALAQVGRQALRFGIAVALARLLTPEDFGLVGMVTVFTAFAALFSDLGFGAAIIQKQDIEQRHLCSVFWINVFAGCALTTVVACCAPLIASFYGEPAIMPLMVVLSFSFVIGSLFVVQNAILTKRMCFKQLAVIKIISILIAGVLAVAMALTGFGLWSLVVNSLVITIVSVVLMWWFCDWRPGFSFEMQAVKELFGFSSRLVGFNITNYWTSNIDKMLIGKYVSAAALGIYDRAYNLMLLPLTDISWVISRVMFPALSAIQNDRKKVKDVFLQANRGIALITFPMMIGLLAVARPFILTLYGDKWEGVIVILQVFCIDGMARSTMTTVGWIYLSQGRSDLQFKWGLFVGIVKAVAIVIGLRWGALGVAVALVLTLYVILLYPGWTIPGRLINMTFTEVMANVASIFFCAAVMGLAVAVVGVLLPQTWPQWAYLMVQVPFGVALYSALIHTFRVRAYCEVRELAAEQLLSRRKESRNV